jgi:multidrug resistance protein MdtO
MSRQGDISPPRVATESLDEVGVWFWDFLKKELTPYPGRAWVVGRVTISVTIVMLLVMTFRIPSGFLGAIFVLLLSRENPSATFRAGLRTILAFVLAMAYVALGVAILIDDPLTHFLWVASSLFSAFYLIRILADYGTAAAFGFMIAGSIPLWDQTALDVNSRFENTLWLAYVVAIGVVVTVAVEYIFRRIHPTTDLTEGIEIRLQTVENVLRAAANSQVLEGEWDKKLSLYATVGTSRLRRLIVRSEYGPHFKSQMSSVIALVGRLVDIAASLNLALREQGGPIDRSDRERCTRLADELAVLRGDLMRRQLPQEIQLASLDQPSQLPFLGMMERTVVLIPKLFAGSGAMQEFIAAPLDDDEPARLFSADAFSNPEHAKFALRGTLAAVVCYITYTAIDWPGLSTSLATCFITALSTIGSSRQKQVLRLGGAILGGIFFGMGAQVFVLPYLDTIAGFTLLVATVTAISAWIATASARLSYLGVQLALAFYLINLQEFRIETSLAVARDRVFGVLLGLASMWLLFDHLWVRKASDEMQTVFARNLNMFAELAEQLLEEDHIRAIKCIRRLRDQINAGFESVTAQADALLFEFGPERQRNLQIRADIRRWQPALRTLLQVQVTFAQYLVQGRLTRLSPAITQASMTFERDIVRVIQAMADEVSGRPGGEGPDIKSSVAKFRQELQGHYQDLGVPIPPEASDIIDLTESLSTVLWPIYEDIRATFSGKTRPVDGNNPYLQGAPQP